MTIVILAGIVVTLVTIIPVLLQLRAHPRGLVILFFAEMWERFSYYGMRALLVFYLTQNFLFSDSFANGQYGAYTTLVYLLPLLGGFLADRYLGTRKAIAFGAILLVAGHFMMGIEQKPATQTLTYQSAVYKFEAEGRGEDREVQLLVDGQGYNVRTEDGVGMIIEGLPAGASLPQTLPEGSYSLGVEGRQPLYVNIFFLALALISMGVGFLKPNISTIVGQLYEERDPRRDPGFTLYYYGINLGAFWSAILCGYVGTNIGWWAGFGLAGVGMAIGFVVFVLGKPMLEGRGEPPDPEKLKARALGPLSREHVIYLLAALGVAAVWGVLRLDASVREWTQNAVAAFEAANPGAGVPFFGLGAVQFFAVVGSALLIGSLAVLGYLIWYMAAKCDRLTRDRMTLALILIGSAVVFWTLFEQAGTSLNLFAARNTQLDIWPTDSISIFGFNIAMTFQATDAQSFNSGFILLFAPVFSALWAWLEKLRRDPNDTLKFSIALIQVGLGFLVLVYGAQFADDDFRVPLIFLALAYLLHTTGELCISPVGLSMVTKMSATAVVSTMMAVWFLSSAWAQWIGAFIAALAGTETVAGQATNPQAALESSISVFQMIGFVGIGIGVGLGVLSFWLNRLAHDVEPGRDRAQEIPAE